MHERPEICRTLLSRARGFMFSRPGDRALVFPLLPARKESLHMFFVFGAIDVLYLDGQGKILALKERFRPWRVWDPQVLASAIVELPEGTIARTGTLVGDHVALPAITIRK